MKMILCMDCAKKLGGKWLGGKLRYGTCDRCHASRKLHVYEVAVNQPDDPQRVEITLEVDPRTAANLRRLADLWGVSVGEVADSVMKNFYNKTKKKDVKKND